MLISSALVYDRLLVSGNSSIGLIDQLSNDFDLLIIDSLIYSSASVLVASSIDTYRSRFDAAAQNGFNDVTHYTNDFQNDLSRLLVNLSIDDTSLKTISGISIVSGRSRSYLNSVSDYVHYEV